MTIGNADSGDSDRAFGDADPDPTSWTVVYRAPGAPALFVTVDAITGAVRRSWRG